MLFLIFTSIFFLSCRHNSTPYLFNSSEGWVDKANGDEIKLWVHEIDQIVEHKSLGKSSLMGAGHDPSQIPEEINQHVEKWIKYFTEEDKERFGRYLSRGEYYRETILKILKEEGVPEDLYFLALIESGFSNAALSRARALGIWQFIAATGKRYQLGVDSYVDERRDPIKSTRAAARYLRDLYNVFHSWFLAMAAYNAGEFRVMQSIMGAGTRDFWQLARQKALPKETMNYVPKFIAAAIIGKNPEKFGIRVEHEGAFPEMKLVKVPSPIRLADIARSGKMSVEEMKELNPHYIDDYTPPYWKEAYIYVPEKMVRNFENETANQNLLSYKNKLTKELQIKVAKNLKKQKSKTYQVKKGDTLIQIAKQFNADIRWLKKFNKLKGDQIRIGQVLRINSKNML